MPGGDFEKMALYWYTLYTRKQEMKKLRSGFLLKDLLDRAEEKASRTLSPDRNLWMYFAHGPTITSLLNTLGLFETVQIVSLDAFILLYNYQFSLDSNLYFVRFISLATYSTTCFMFDF